MSHCFCKLDFHSVEDINLPRPNGPLKSKFLDPPLHLYPIQNVIGSALAHSVLLESIQKFSVNLLTSKTTK